MASPQRIDLSNVDHWAVDTVVTEGVRMKLSEAEYVLAAAKLRNQGKTQEQIADRLHVSYRKAEALMRRAERNELVSVD